MKKTLTYSQTGVQYEVLDPVKKMAQTEAAKTAEHLLARGFSEVSDTRGESAFVWKMGNMFLASVIEGLGTKNLVADGVADFAKKTYYDVVGYDTVATIVNDLITVGARPLVIHAYWASGAGDIFKNTKKMQDLIKGWKRACDDAGVVWGGGETPTLSGIINPAALDLGGSAVGIIPTKKQLLTDKKLKTGDRILLLKSSGVNANGISLTRAIAKKLPKGYATLLPSGKTYGETLLTKTHIYAKLVEDLMESGVDIHYITNITGHGMRKIMRARQDFTYVIEKVFPPQEIFGFIQKQANLDDQEMYQTYNMGQDYAIFVSVKDVAKTLSVIKKNKFTAIDSGFVKKGKKQVIIQSKNLVYSGKTLDLR